MTEFNPWLTKAQLEEHNRKRQITPLDAPYGYNVADCLNAIQVKERPEDPDSPFIWGHAVLSLVCGGAFNPLKTATGYKGGRKKRYSVTLYGYEGREDYPEPEPWLSNDSTTNALLARMLRVGFTWEGALATLLRHEHAGGAYLAWMHRFEDEEKTADMLSNWRASKTYEEVNPVTGEVSYLPVPDHGPLSIDSSWNPWTGKTKGGLSISSIIGTPGVPIMDDITKTWAPLHGTDQMRVISDKTVSEILRAIKLKAQDSPLEANGVPVVGVHMIKDAGLVNIKGKIDGLLRNLYLPYLVEQGKLIEYPKDQMVKCGPRRGQLPHFAYALPVEETPIPIKYVGPTITVQELMSGSSSSA